MLKICTQFKKTESLPQANSFPFPLSPYGAVFHGVQIAETDASSLTLENTLDIVAGINKKPELGGSGCESVETGTSIPPIIADMDLPASEKIIAAIGAAMHRGFVKIYREGLELLDNDWQAFLLLTQISLRALRADCKFNKHKLEIGEALIGDYQRIGLTEQQYRDAKWRLQFKYKIITCRRTNRGTIAKLLTSDIYDINPRTEERTEEHSKNGQRTTKEEVKNIRKEKIQKKTSGPKTASDDAAALLEFFNSSLKKNVPEVPEPCHPAQAVKFDALLEKGFTTDEIRSVIEFAHTGWWAQHAHDPGYIKLKFSVMLAQLRRKDQPLKSAVDRRTKNVDGSAVSSPTDGRF